MLSRRSLGRLMGATFAARVIGLGGLMMQNVSETHHLTQVESKPAAPRIYRETACGIELPVVQRLKQAVVTLEERIKEKNWQVNGEVCGGDKG